MRLRPTILRIKCHAEKYKNYIDIFSFTHGVPSLISIGQFKF